MAERVTVDYVPERPVMCLRRQAKSGTMERVLMVGVAQRQSVALWMRMLWVRDPSPTHQLVIRGVTCP